MKPDIPFIDGMLTSKSPPSNPDRRWYPLRLRTPLRAVFVIATVFSLLLPLIVLWVTWEMTGHELAVGTSFAFAVSVPVMLLIGWLIRHGFQFRLRTLMVSVLLFAVACSWVAVRRQQAGHVKAIRQAGGNVTYDYEWAEGIGTRRQPPRPAWLVKLLGVDCFADVACVNFSEWHPGADDSVTEHLEGMTRLRKLVLRGSHVTDTGAEHLKRLTHLETLWLSNTRVTDAGLVHLKGMTQLTDLRLPSRTSDAGLEHLKGLTELVSLDLRGTHITDAGLVHLKGFTKLESLLLPGTQITDAGLVHLKGLTDLVSLDLRGTHITDAGLEHLERLTNLEVLDLDRTQVTDAGLEHLKGLAKLKRLTVDEIGVTDEGIKRLRQALPGCNISHY